MKGLWVEIRICPYQDLSLRSTHQLLPWTKQNCLREINWICCQSIQNKVMRINLKNIFPPLLLSLCANFIPDSLPPSPQQCRGLGMGGVVSSWHVVFTSHSSSQSSPAPARHPSHGGQSSVNFSNVNHFHRLQFFMNCSRIGLFCKVQFFGNRLLCRSIVAHGATSPANEYISV